jgi:proteasome lid subunit RPN8/RPN11
VSVALSRELIASIQNHGVGHFPHECCGFLLGTAGDGRKCVRRLLRAENAREDAARRNRFLITPEDYQASERAAREAGLDVLGFYHSHPNAPARPSQYDLDHAWPWYSYVIVATTADGAGEMTSWVLEDDRSRFTPEPIEIGVGEQPWQ